MFNFGKKKILQLEAKHQKAIKERNAARVQRDKARALAKARRTRLQQMEAELVAAHSHAALLDTQVRAAHSGPPHPGPAAIISVPPGSSWPPPEPPWFFADNLAVWAKNTTFLYDDRFLRAYRRGMHSGHHMARPKGSDADIHIEWRVHVILWAAMQGAKLAGDFVECGVNTGIYSLAICDYLDFNSLNKQFWLFDTFNGIPEEQMSPQEKSAARAEMSTSYYSECFEAVKTSFVPWPRAHLVRGMVPDSLQQVEIGQVCYLSIDLNIALPEISAIEHFWPKLSPGACVVLDDYGWGRHEEQRDRMDAFAGRAGVTILSLPTGQGLLIKPVTAQG